MERLVKGEVVVIPFPFSDLSSVKKRPALVIAALKGDDIILCQITSQARTDEYAIALTKKEFGELKIDSLIRPSRLFTADKTVILRRIGSLKQEKIQQVIEKVCKIIRA